MLDGNRYYVVCTCIRSYLTRQKDCCSAIVARRFKSLVFELITTFLARMSGRKSTSSSRRRGGHVGAPPKRNAPQRQSPRESPQEIVDEAVPLTQEDIPRII